MANEGSTKPTYSELEAELLRVRGLLQRQWISVEERLPEKRDDYLTLTESGYRFVGSFAHGQFLHNDAIGGKITHWQPLPELPSGAESADIGKLDSADNKDLQIVRVLRACGKTMNGGQFENFVTHIVIPLVEHHWLAGSTETGGEKADV